MDTWKQKLTSRKFLMMIGAVAVVVGAYLQGQIDSTALITGIISAIGIWTASEAVVDAAAATANPKTPKEEDS